MSDQRGNYGSGQQRNQNATPNGSYANYQNNNAQGSGEYGSRNYGSANNRYAEQGYVNRNNYAGADNKGGYGRGYNNNQGANRGYGYQGGPGNYQNQNHGYTANQGHGFSQNQGQGFNQNQGFAPNQEQTIQVPWDKYELKKRSDHGPVCNVMLTIGSWITFARNFVFNIIFLLLMFFVFGGYMAVQSLKENGISFSSTTADQINAIADKAEVLYFDLNGPISEMPFSSSQIDVLQRELESALYGKMSHELVAIEKALELSANDSTIKKVIISVDGMNPVSLSVAERIGSAMELAKAKDKRAEGSDFSREVVVVGTTISQSAYAIAAHADKIVMDSLGEVDLRGISMTSLYFKDMLEKAQITPYIFRAGHFKSAVEPFMLNAMSPDVRREYQAIAFKSWDIYKKSIGARSKIAVKSREILPEANIYAQWIRRYGGDRAQLQLAQGLVDEIMPLNLYYEELSEQVNADYDRPYRPAIITYQDYLMRHHALTSGKKAGALSQIEVRPAAIIGYMNSIMANSTSVSPLSSAAATLSKSTDVASAITSSASAEAVGSGSVADAGSATKLQANGYNYTANGTDRSYDRGAENNRTPLQFSDIEAISEAKRQIERRLKEGKKASSNTVAVIYGIGEITDYPERPSDFAYDNIAPQIEEAMMNDNIAAVVLYLNSPGGSVIASEKIRRSLEALQKYTVKPIIVSMNGTAASGAYWIGSQAEKIFATQSTITGSIGVFGLSFGAHRLLNKYGAYQDGVATNELAQAPIAKEMPYSQQMMYNLAVEKTYKDFVELVAKNRGLKANTYEIFAEGQIFLAEEAQTLGLVDEVGNLSDAIAYAAKQAGIDSNRLRVRHMSPESPNELGGFESLLFGLSNAYLPPEFTEAMLKLRQNSKMLKKDGSNNLMAISPITDPKL
ncbi:S49 family peptidase [Anaerobiospirillum succiniciproducens]|uniref:S49 family peptidase n=1 Tax=Anaerobiospirillum succiniciproducens TaxID=13335 RepID=UPI00248E2340|nr:S49 family peptidase [Anaerobiospirillum succiniciproducens]